MLMSTILSTDLGFFESRNIAGMGKDVLYLGFYSFINFYKKLNNRYKFDILLRGFKQKTEPEVVAEACQPLYLYLAFLNSPTFSARPSDIILLMTESTVWMLTSGRAIWI